MLFYELKIICSKTSTTLLIVTYVTNLVKGFYWVLSCSQTFLRVLRFWILWLNPLKIRVFQVEV